MSAVVPFKTVGQEPQYTFCSHPNNELCSIVHLLLICLVIYGNHPQGVVIIVEWLLHIMADKNGAKP